MKDPVPGMESPNRAGGRRRVKEGINERGREKGECRRDELPKW
jgi:hypothetical protein